MPDIFYVKCRKTISFGRVIERQSFTQRSMGREAPKNIKCPHSTLKRGMVLIKRREILKFIPSSVNYKQ